MQMFSWKQSNFENWESRPDLQDYQGGRDFNSLKKFAEENLGPLLGQRISTCIECIEVVAIEFDCKVRD